MPIRYSVIAVLLLALVYEPARAQRVTVWISSSGGDRIARKPAVTFKRGSGTGETIRVDPEKRDQTMLGFGGSFQEAGIRVLNTLPPREQENVLRALFDPKSGAGFTALKTPIAGTDFQSAGPWYTYDDTPGDTALKRFSVTRDLGPNGLITFIKRAKRYGSFILQAPMDYPPDWMLFNVKRHQDIDPKYYDTLARYYLAYVQAYAKNGVDVNYVSLFNEPLNYTKINYSEILDLLKNHVGPTFAKAHVKTKLMLSEAVTRADALDFYPTVLDDPTARGYVAAIPYHGYDFYGFGRIAELHKRYPTLPLWMTELCYAYESGYPMSKKLPIYDFADGVAWGYQIFGDVGAGASAWNYWNLILDEHGGPWAESLVHGNPPYNIQHPLVIVDSGTHAVTYTGAFWFLAHFSKFVRPGAVRIGCEGATEGVRALAFQDANGGITVEAMNGTTSERTVGFAWKDRTLPITLPPQSITTLTWR